MLNFVSNLLMVGIIGTLGPGKVMMTQKPQEHPNQYSIMYVQGLPNFCIEMTSDRKHPGSVAETVIRHCDFIWSGDIRVRSRS